MLASFFLEWREEYCFGSGMDATLGPWASHMTPDQLTWLLFGDGPSDNNKDVDRVMLVEEVWLDGVSNSSMIDEMLRPVILATAHHKGICFGEGWMLHQCLSPMSLILGEDGIGAYPVRYTVVENEIASKISVMSVQRGDHLLFISFTEVDRNTLSVCIQKPFAVGQSLTETSLHTFHRCCSTCSDLQKNCQCSFKDGVLAELGVFSEENRIVEKTVSKGVYSPWSNGTWRMENEHMLSTSMFEMTMQYSERKELVDIYWNRAFAYSSKAARGNSNDTPNHELGPRRSTSGAQLNTKAEKYTTHTLSSPSGESSRGLYSCNSCASSFKTSYDRRRHTDSVHCKQKKYKCEYCGKLFSQSGHRNEHERKFHLDQCHKCEICSHRFGVLSKLQRHVRAVHENLRSHRCEICNKMFKEKTHLKKHSLSHLRMRRIANHYSTPPFLDTTNGTSNYQPDQQLPTNDFI